MPHQVKANAILFTTLFLAAIACHAAEPAVPVPAQPLAANVTRLVEALEFLGAALPEDVKKSLAEAAAKPDGDRLQQLLDKRSLFIVELNPESRVKARRGPAGAILQQGGYTPTIVKVVNLSTVTKELRITSPQAGQVYAGMTPLSARRMQREPLREVEVKAAGTNQFLDVEIFARPPMTPHLSGLEVEYALALIHSRDAGKREATIAFDVGGTTQDLGFRAEVPVLFDIQPAIPVKGKQKRLDFAAWCDGLARGRSYVSDGFAHALAFKVNGTAPGFGDVRLDTAGEVSIEAQAAFAPETPALVAHGFALPPGGERWSGDTVTLHGSRTNAITSGGERVVEIIVNGRPAASARVPADGKTHALQFRVPISA